jgi:hypothetical protein
LAALGAHGEIVGCGDQRSCQPLLGRGDLD